MTGAIAVVGGLIGREVVGNSKRMDWLLIRAMLRLSYHAQKSYSEAMFLQNIRRYLTVHSFGERRLFGMINFFLFVSILYRCL